MLAMTMLINTPYIVNTTVRLPDGSRTRFTNHSSATMSTTVSAAEPLADDGLRGLRYCRGVGSVVTDGSANTGPAIGR
jgi:hypothetical protein